MLSLLTLYSLSLELILLIIAIAANFFLAFAVYRSNPKSATNIIFALLSLFTSLWLINNYVASHILEILQYSDLALLVGRFGILWAAPMSAIFFLLAHTLPSATIGLSRKNFYVTIGLTLLMMVLNISPYAFVGVAFNGTSLELVPGPGLLPFAVISTVFSILAVYFLVKKHISSEGNARKQIGLVLGGIIAMLVLIIATILIPIILFNSLHFLPLTPIYTLIFLGMTAYAITKYQLFNIKVLVTEALTLAIWIVLFGKLFGEESFNAKIVDGFILLFTVIFGFFLVRSVKREVEQRKLIEKQEKELEVVNQQQESLLHFISHEVKGYLTDSEAGFASIFEGDFGSVTPQLKTMAESALAGVRRGVATVMDILDASNLKKGTVTYVKKPFDFRTTVQRDIAELKPAVYEKHLGLDVDIAEGKYQMEGDEEKIREHVIRNLIDNAIKYTPTGTIRVELNDRDGKIRFSVKDSGIGITPEDMQKLFTEGGHGKDSIKVNVHSTGYGLFIAKQIVEAHGGKIWAESEGNGKGSKFIIEFPIS